MFAIIISNGAFQLKLIPIMNIISYLFCPLNPLEIDFSIYRFIMEPWYNALYTYYIS